MGKHLNYSIGTNTCGSNSIQRTSSINSQKSAKQGTLYYDELSKKYYTYDNNSFNDILQTKDFLKSYNIDLGTQLSKLSPSSEGQILANENFIIPLKDNCDIEDFKQNYKTICQKLQKLNDHNHEIDLEILNNTLQEFIQVLYIYTQWNEVIDFIQESELEDGLKEDDLKYITKKAWQSIGFSDGKNLIFISNKSYEDNEEVKLNSIDTSDTFKIQDSFNGEVTFKIELYRTLENIVDEQFREDLFAKCYRIRPIVLSYSISKIKMRDFCNRINNIFTNSTSFNGLNDPIDSEASLLGQIYNSNFLKYTENNNDNLEITPDPRGNRSINPINIVLNPTLFIVMDYPVEYLSFAEDKMFKMFLPTLDCSGRFLAAHDEINIELPNNNYTFDPSCPEILEGHCYEYHVLDGVFSFFDITGDGSKGEIPGMMQER